jgi:hypothetical protein
MLRIGHRGAAALAPENTIAAMRAAIAAGVDMVEFDVAPGLAVGHDGRRPGRALAAFLAELVEIAPPELGFLVDLKGRGYEHETLAACRAAGIADRCVFSTADLRSLAVLNGHARTSATISPGRWVPWSRVTPPTSTPGRAPATPPSGMTSSRRRPSKPSTDAAAGSTPGP